MTSNCLKMNLCYPSAWQRKASRLWKKKKKVCVCMCVCIHIYIPITTPFFIISFIIGHLKSHSVVQNNNKNVYIKFSMLPQQLDETFVSLLSFIKLHRIAAGHWVNVFISWLACKIPKQCSKPAENQVKTSTVKVNICNRLWWGPNNSR